MRWNSFPLFSSNSFRKLMFIECYCSNSFFTDIMAYLCIGIFRGNLFLIRLRMHVQPREMWIVVKYCFSNVVFQKTIIDDLVAVVLHRSCRVEYLGLWNLPSIDSHPKFSSASYFEPPGKYDCTNKSLIAFTLKDDVYSKYFFAISEVSWGGRISFTPFHFLPQDTNPETRLESWVFFEYYLLCSYSVLSSKTKFIVMPKIIHFIIFWRVFVKYWKLL